MRGLRVQEGLHQVDVPNRLRKDRSVGAGFRQALPRSERPGSMATERKRERRVTSEERPPRKTGPKPRSTDLNEMGPREHLRLLAEIVVYSEREDGPDRQDRAFFKYVNTRIQEFHGKHLCPRSQDVDLIPLHDAASLLYSVLRPRGLEERAAHRHQTTEEAKAQVLRELDDLLPGFGTELLTPEVEKVIRSRKDYVEAAYTRVGQCLRPAASMSKIRDLLKPLGSITEPIPPRDRRRMHMPAPKALWIEDSEGIPRTLEVALALTDAAADVMGLDSAARAELDVFVRRVQAEASHARASQLIQLLSSPQEPQPAKPCRKGRGRQPPG